MLPKRGGQAENMTTILGMVIDTLFTNLIRVHYPQLPCRISNQLLALEIVIATPTNLIISPSFHER